MTEKDTAQNVQELNLDTKVTVRSIAGWSTGFSRIESVGDVTITPEGTTRLSRNEIISQVQNGNKLFCGLNGDGSHATLYIDDAPTRAYLDFESEDGETKQNVFSDAKVKEVFGLKTQAAFEKACKETFYTRAEKYALIQAIKRLKINDYSKIRFAEEYTGYRVQ